MSAKSAVDFSKLIGRRVLLRRLEPRDLQAHLALRRDPEVLKFQSFGRDYDDAAASAYLKEMAVRHPADGKGWFNLCIAEIEGDRHAGDLGVKVEGDLAELGVTLEPRVRGLGYATEALTVLIDWLMHEGIRHLKAEADARNEKSIAIFRDRLGFQFSHRYQDGAVAVDLFTRRLAPLP